MCLCCCSLDVKGVLNEYYAQVRKQDYLKKSIEQLRGMSMSIVHTTSCFFHYLST